MQLGSICRLDTTTDGVHLELIYFFLNYEAVIQQPNESNACTEFWNVNALANTIKGGNSNLFIFIWNQTKTLQHTQDPQRCKFKALGNTIDCVQLDFFS